MVAVSPEVGAETARGLVAVAMLTGMDTREEGEGRTPRGPAAPGGIREQDHRQCMITQSH